LSEVRALADYWMALQAGGISLDMGMASSHAVRGNQSMES